MSETATYRYVQKLEVVYFKQFLRKPRLIVRSPGRVNIIGEHTDYNQGFVLPAAIDMYAYVAVDKTKDGKIHLYATEFKEQFITDAGASNSPRNSWTDYVIGVVDQLQKNGYSIGGFNLLLSGNLPIGAGMSSSAAVECATIFALNELFQLKLEKLQMVKLAQKAEHTFTGVQCGIMDMFASMFGKKNHVLKLDCRSLNYEYVPFNLPGIKIVLFNTNVKHSLASSAYNQRRQQCEQGVAWIKEKRPSVNSLRDATPEMLDELVAPKDKLIYQRCKYVVEENGRLQKLCEDLLAGNIAALGQKMFQTHEGLRNLFEVSCKELDFLIDAVKQNPAVLGARMMGGGFGGCTINLVKEDAIADLAQQLSFDYKKETGLELTAYTGQIENGTEKIV
jgi:galactokinase